MFHSTFRQLEVFVAVVDEGSFASGAERLAISQPAISNHIRALESQVGCKLLDRRRGTTCDLTIAGRQLYEEATTLLAQVDRLEQRLQHIRAREQKRELTIMASFYVIKQWMQPLVQSLSPVSTASCRSCGPDHSRKLSPACAAAA